MKQLTRTISLASLALLLIYFESCLQEKFIPDPADPRLPKYTECGNEVAGALINNVAWKSEFFVGFDNPSIDPCYLTNYISGDSATIEFVGECNQGPSKGSPISFLVSLPNFQIPAINDLTRLSGQTFTIDGTKNAVRIVDYFKVINSRKKVFKGGSGELTIIKIKPISNVTIGGSNGAASYHPMIMAGTFKFNFNADTVKIESGRFDFEIYDDDYRLIKN